MKFPKQTLYILIAIVSFLILSLSYFSPLLNGKQLSQNDVIQFKGGGQEIFEHYEGTGDFALWTNSMFGGMPGYLVATNYTNFVKKIPELLKVDHKHPQIIVFFCLVVMFIALLLFGLDVWQASLGALFYGFSSYFFIILEAGHITKAIAMIYMPLLAVSVYMAFNKKLILGTILFGFSLALQISSSHYQITYYTALMMLVFYVFVIVDAVKQKSNYFDTIVKPSLLLVLAVLLAAGANFARLYHTYDYGKQSIRGKSELSVNKDDKTSGLDKSYATAWSYGVDETFTLLVPNFKGGSSVGSLGKDSNVFKALQSRNVPNAESIVKGLPLYWGTQSSTSGPVYVGAIVVFLFVLGLLIVKGRLKWWLLSATIMSIVLAWGSNMMWLTDIFLDYFPAYNKFRTVSMILVVAELAMPLLGIVALKTFIEDTENRKQNLKMMQYAFAGVGGVLVLLWLFAGGLYDFSSAVDGRLQASGWPDFLLDALREDRKAMFTSDALRSLFFVAVTAGLLFLYHLQKVRYQYLMLALALFTLGDMWSVNKRYLNNDDFVPERKAYEFKKTPADILILKDTELNYRVANLAVSTFNDARTSYYHKSIGGYHGAKLRRYQEFIEHHITNDLMPLYQIQQYLDRETNNYLQEMSKKGMKTASKSEVKNMLIDQMGPQINQMLKKAKSLNVLNLKYAIVDPESKPVVNDNRYGNAWFVQSISFVDGADAEIALFADIDPKKTAVVDSRFSGVIADSVFAADSTARIILTDYAPGYVSYSTESRQDQVAIFSEVYYENGWNAYIDGQLHPHFRADYILRGIRVPAGKHTVEFKFEPKSYAVGNIISGTFSAILILLVIGYIVVAYMNKKKEEQPRIV